MSSSGNASEPGVLIAVNIHRACHVLTIIIASFLFLCDFTAIYKNRSKGGFNIRKPGTRIRYWQMFVAVGILAHSICFSIALFGDFREKQRDCYYLMGLVPLIFLSVKTFVEFFLYDRAKVVHDALRLNWKLIIMLRWVIWISICGLLPIFAPSIILFFYGLVLPEGICIQICSKYEIPLAFMLGDFCLGSAMVILFTLPIMSHAKNMTAAGFSEDFSHDLRRIIKTNLIYSSIIIFSGIASLVVYSAIFLVYQNGETYYHAFADITPNLDFLVITVLVHVMDTHWMPERMKMFCFKNRAVKSVEDATINKLSGEGVSASRKNEHSSTTNSNSFFNIWRKSANISQTSPNKAVGVRPESRAMVASASAGQGNSTNEEPPSQGIHQ